MLVLRQPLKGGRHSLRDRVGRVGDPSQMCRQPVLKPLAACTAAATSSASVLGKYRYTVCRVTPRVRATSAMEKSAPCASMAWPAASRIRAIASSSVAGADPDQPWVRTSESYVSQPVSPGRRLAGS